MKHGTIVTRRHISLAGVFGVAAPALQVSACGTEDQQVLNGMTSLGVSDACIGGPQG